MESPFIYIMESIKGKLYIISTPIGNLKDFTFRAVETLKEVKIIAAEDTRVIKKLLINYNINNIEKILVYNEHNEQKQSAAIIELLESGQDIALVTDGGTPLISDPGFRLVVAAISKEIDPVPIPGVSAVTTALSVAGCPTDRFSFLGFVPRTEKQKQDFFKVVSAIDHTVIIFEAPHRILETLKVMAGILVGRKIILCREMTKIYEEFLRGTSEEILSELSKRDSIKGEITVIINKRDQEKNDGMIKIELDKLIDIFKNSALLSPSKASSIIAILSGIDKKDIYKKMIKK